MKVSPLAQGTGTPAASDAGGRSASNEAIARAKAIASGQEPQSSGDRQVDRAQNDIKKIKMRTQRSVWRDQAPESVTSTETNVPSDTLTPEITIPDTSVKTKLTSEDTKPLSPQFAALAKAKRDLQVMEKRLKDREQALTSQGQGPSQQDLIDRLKSNPLSVLNEHGVTYDQLVESITANQNERTPSVIKLEAELKALKEGLDNQNKILADRDNAQKQQVLNQMSNDADKIIAQGDQYEMIRETGSRKDVINLIEQTFDKTGEVLDLEEALQLVEDELVEESLKIARIKKVQGRLNPAPQEVTNQKIQNSNVRTMRTLTNRDGARVPSSARERAIAAFHGRK
jgi:hypothetical protein